MRYRLTEKIGTGGMAEGFRAVGEGPEGFERPFVVKRIHPHLSQAPEFVRMFVDEAKISARLIHPNIVQVFEFAHQDGSYFIVMEPVEGLDMGWFRRRKSERPAEFLPTTFVAEVGRQVCRGLDFAHTLTDAEGKPLGIVHRDVTPPNIMVAWNGTVKVLDFGIARAVEAVRSNQSDVGMVKGKIPYLAPELLDGATADGRSDVFSLGAVLHELLTGEQLFAAENDLETLKKVKEMPILPPSAWNPGVKPALDGVVMRALERDPAKRYRSAGQMGDELEALVLRKSYSTRALARKARELAGQDPAAASGAAIPERSVGAPSGAVIEQPPSTFTADRGERRATPRPTPPPLPPGAIPAGLGSRWPWIWLGVTVPAIVAAVTLGAIVRRPISVTIPSLPQQAATPSATVSVAVDSVPQGATVTSAAIGDGRPLGETPVVLTLPRGTEAVEVLLRKAGFAPLAFKIVPHQDKDVVARLEAPAPVATVTRPRPSDAARRPPPPVPPRAPVAMATPPGPGAPRPSAPPAATAKAPAPATAANNRPGLQRPAWSAPIPRR